MQLTISIPDDVAVRLQNGGAIERKVLEFVALQGYLSEELTAYDVQRMLGLASRFDVDAFFKTHGVQRAYTLDDLEQERATAAAVFGQRSSPTHHRSITSS